MEALVDLANNVRFVDLHVHMVHIDVEDGTDGSTRLNLGVLHPGSDNRADGSIDLIEDPNTHHLDKFGSAQTTHMFV